MKTAHNIMKHNLSPSDYKKWCANITAEDIDVIYRATDHTLDPYFILQWGFNWSKSNESHQYWDDVQLRVKARHTLKDNMIMIS